MKTVRGTDMYNLTDKNREDAIKALQEVSEIWTAIKNSTAKRLHVAQCVSVDYLTHEIYNEYAFFNDFISAEMWIGEKYDVRSKYAPFGQTYLNGKLRHQW